MQAYLGLLTCLQWRVYLYALLFVLEVVNFLVTVKVRLALVGATGQRTTASSQVAAELALGLGRATWRLDSIPLARLVAS